MKEKDLITELPESIDSKKNIKLDVRSYGGYSGVSYEGKEMEMFYWFFESKKFHPNFSRDDRKIGETPIIMWFNGGAGSTFYPRALPGEWTLQDARRYSRNAEKQSLQLE